MNRTVLWPADFEGPASHAPGVATVFRHDPCSAHAVIVIPVLPLADLRQEFRLTNQQARVAMLVAARFTNKEIGESLRIRPGTVRSHVEWVFARFGVKKREDVYQVILEFMTAAAERRTSE